MMAIGSLDPTIESFVDREREKRLFQSLLGGGRGKRIMTMQAGAGMGKTWLISNFQRECSRRRIPCALIDFSSSRVCDYIAILRSMRDSLGAEHFNSFTTLVNQYYSRPNLPWRETDVADSSSVEISGSTLDSSRIESVAGHDIIRDNFIVFAGPSLPPHIIRDRLTTEFRRCLIAFVNSLSIGDCVVWLFDSFEKADPETRDWLRDEFLCKIREGEVNRLVVVIAGQEVLHLAMEWNHVALRCSLEPFSPQDYHDYLRVKRFPLPKENIRALHRRFQGRPLDLAVWVDSAIPNNEEWL